MSYTIEEVYLKARLDDGVCAYIPMSQNFQHHLLAIPSQQPTSLTRDDKHKWWNFLRNFYPDNYAAAQRYYDLNPASRPCTTVNEYFKMLGLPQIYTDRHHSIQVRKDL